jgi:hypothetical protein
LPGLVRWGGRAEVKGGDDILSANLSLVFYFLVVLGLDLGVSHLLDTLSALKGIFQIESCFLPRVVDEDWAGC